MRIAVFPGSFDPLTKGHEEIIRKAIPLFDKIYVAIGENANKKSCFSLEQRLQWIRQAFADESCVETAVYEGLTIEVENSMDSQIPHPSKSEKNLI